MKAYWENRKERTIVETFGKYRLTIRYMANCNKAQVSMEDISLWRYPLLWSVPMNDEQANSALELFKAIGFFKIAEEA